MLIRREILDIFTDTMRIAFRVVRPERGAIIWQDNFSKVYL